MSEEEREESERMWKEENEGVRMTERQRGRRREKEGVIKDMKRED